MSIQKRTMSKNTSDNMGMTPIFVKEKQYVLFDWPNVVHRAFAVGDVDGFANLLFKMMLNYRKQFPSSEFVYAVEGGGAAVRRKVLPTYKMHRTRHDEIDRIINDSIELLKMTECLLIKAKDGEADDAIATFVKKREVASRVVIVSEDTDLWQLIKSPAVTVLSKGRGTVTEEICLRKFKVRPSKLPMIKSLLGDKSDGIPPAIPRLRKDVAVRIAARAAKPEEIMEAVSGAEWSSSKLTEKIVNKRAEIDRNFGLIKLKRDLKLRRKKCRSDWRRLSLFLHNIGAVGLEETDVKIVAG